MAKGRGPKPGGEKAGTALVPVTPGLPALPTLPPRLEDLLRESREENVADNTAVAYARDWTVFEAWCREQELPALPATPETVAAFVVDCSAVSKTATLTRRVGGISWKHRTELPNAPNPCRAPVVRDALAAVRRKRADSVKRASPIRPALLTRIVVHPETDVRDAAFLVVCYVAALRAESEALSLRWPEDVRVVDGLGFLLQLSGRTEDGRVKRSKTDQEAVGQWKAIREAPGVLLDPVAWLRRWIAKRGEKPGLLFGMSKATAVRVVKRAVKRVGEDPKRYSGHSMRAGFVTELRARHASDAEIMAVTGHKDARMLGIYDRPEDLFERIPKDIGLRD